MATQYMFDNNGYLFGVYDGPPQPGCTPIAPPLVEGSNPRFVNGVWVDESAPPKVGPIAFKLLFTATERVRATELKPTDPYIADFWGMLDDPRTDYVDLNLASVQAAIEHTLEAVKTAGIELDVASRKVEILTGVVK